jgi:hypothetical protein
MVGHNGARLGRNMHICRGWRSIGTRISVIWGRDRMPFGPYRRITLMACLYQAK